MARAQVDRPPAVKSTTSQAANGLQLVLAVVSWMGGAEPCGSVVARKMTDNGVVGSFVCSCGPVPEF